jgi:hypothetical protein
MKSLIVLFAVLAMSGSRKSGIDVSTAVAEPVEAASFSGAGLSASDHANQSAHARLAACFKGPGDGAQSIDVDAYIQNRVECYNACDSWVPNKSCDGQTGADSCYERCDDYAREAGWF